MGYLSAIFVPETNDLLGILANCNQQALTIKKKFNHRTLNLAVLPVSVLGSVLSVYVIAGQSTD